VEEPSFAPASADPADPPEHPIPIAPAATNATPLIALVYTDDCAARLFSGGSWTDMNSGQALAGGIGVTEGSPIGVVAR
jgi:hypothetical protein